jgi:hypothetical protein
MPDQDQSAMFAKLVQCVVKLKIELLVCAGVWTGVTPRIAATVVSADSRELFDPTLNQNPVKGKITKAVFDDNRDWSLSRAVDVQAMAA